ncbi:MAG: hypothetical protein P9X24_05875 [Candidatus Hatepunaea meridiana]|nr:hypothetical protein [Candidatus Hatepunaea meridiana]
MKITFVDAGVLIEAARGIGYSARNAFEILDDKDRIFATSIYVKLEVLPKSVFYRYYQETRFYNEFFKNTRIWAIPTIELLERAYDEAVMSGLSAIDAIHIVSAVSIGTDEFVTSEKISKPIHRTELISVVSIQS